MFQMPYKNLKIQLEEPIHKMQEKEIPRQFYFANEFFKSKGTLADFLRYWYEQDETGKWIPKRHLNITPSGDELKFKIPAKNTMESWAKRNQWNIRKRAFWKNTLETAQEEMQQEVIEFFKRDSKKIISSAEDDWQLDEQINYDDFTKPHLKAKGKNELANAHSKKVETLLIQSGMPKDISKQESNMNVKSDLTIANKSNELFTDELEDYNIDDTFNEVTEDVDN